MPQNIFQLIMVARFRKSVYQSEHTDFNVIQTSGRKWLIILKFIVLGVDMHFSDFHAECTTACI